VVSVQEMQLFLSESMFLEDSYMVNNGDCR